jgi:hypothetical protein
VSDYRNNPEWRSNRDRIAKNISSVYAINVKSKYSPDKVTPAEHRQRDELEQELDSLISRQVELEHSSDNRTGCDNPNGDCGRFGSHRASQTDWKNGDPGRFGYNRRSRLEAWEDCGPGSSRALPTARPAYED